MNSFTAAITSFLGILRLTTLLFFESALQAFRLDDAID
jgi:hypothetical protein